MSKPTLYYFGLEPVRSRYTKQLCDPEFGWMPSALRSEHWDFVNVVPALNPHTDQINTGAVLDCIQRPLYAMGQCQNFLLRIEKGQIKDGDILYFQDLTTHGIESIFYALHQKKIKVFAYAMVHANTFDEHDFTNEMAHWMRHSDIAACHMMTHLFVASQCHRDQIKNAGVKTPISVVSLPIDYADVDSAMPKIPKKNQIIYCSRMDKEKRPHFMLAVARQFLALHKDYEWVCTTSAPVFKSYNEDLAPLFQFAQEEPRFKMLANLSKADYYLELAKSKVQFNCSLQDYVSWTCLEACIAGCDLVYPDFRSFPEFIRQDRLYNINFPTLAVSTIERALARPQTHHRIAHHSDDYRKNAIPHVVRDTALGGKRYAHADAWAYYVPGPDQDSV